MWKNLWLLVASLLIFCGCGWVLVNGGQEIRTSNISISPIVLVSPAAAPTKNALFIGDSYTAGTGATSVRRSESFLTAQAMGWGFNVDAQPGTGFIADGLGRLEPLPARLERDKQYFPDMDMVIVDSGRNDAAGVRANTIRVARTYFAKLHDVYPHAKIIFIVPYYMASTSPPLSDEFTIFLTEQAALYGGLVIDPLQEKWITPNQSSALTINDHVHPNNSGHQWIADHLVADLKKARL